MSDGVFQISVGLLGVLSLVTLVVLGVQMRSRRARARRLAAALQTQPYGRPPEPLRTPFPPPPPVLTGTAPRPAERPGYQSQPYGQPEVRLSAPDHAAVPTPGSRPPLPSGLAGARGVAPSVYQPKPSGLQDGDAAPRHRAPEPGAWTGSAHSEPRVADVYPQRYQRPEPRQEPASRLRQPAYLADRPADRGRHRADPDG